MEVVCELLLWLLTGDREGVVEKGVVCLGE